VTALREMGSLAVTGDARAQNNLGLMFHRGHGVPRDDAQAAAWFRKAAEQAHVSAQCNLAVMYLKGDGIPQDYGEAIYWFREAAAKGHPRAKYNLAVMYLKGDGVPRNADNAVSLFREAAAAGHRGATEILSQFDLQHPNEGTTPSEESARRSAGAERKGGSVPPKTNAQAGRASEAPPVAARGAFRVQLGAVRSQAVAVQEAERLNRVHGPVLGDIRVTPVRAELGERGVFWRLRAGPFEDRRAAEALCGRIAERDQACIVVKNQDRDPARPAPANQ